MSDYPLTFVPNTNQIKFNQIDLDIKRFERRLQLHFHFTDPDTVNYDRVTTTAIKTQKFLNNPDYWPRKLNPIITEFCYNLKSHILSLITANKQHNTLSKYEKTALKNLKNNKNITIKKADKNSGIVVMNTLDYINKVDAMLSDTNVYTPVVLDDTWTVKLHSDDILRNIKIKGYINVNNSDISLLINEMIQLVFSRVDVA